MHSPAPSVSPSPLKPPIPQPCVPIWLTGGCLGMDGEQSRAQNSQPGVKPPVLRGYPGGAAAPDYPPGSAARCLQSTGRSGHQAEAAARHRRARDLDQKPSVLETGVPSPDWSVSTVKAAAPLVLFSPSGSPSAPGGPQARGASPPPLACPAAIPFCIPSPGCPVDTSRDVFLGMQGQGQC